MKIQLPEHVKQIIHRLQQEGGMMPMRWVDVSEIHF